MRSILWVLIIAVLSGCSLFKGQSNQPVPPLAWLAPEQGPYPSLLKQKLTLTAYGHTKEMIAVTRLSKDRVSMVGLTPTGQTVVQIHYAANGFQSTPPASPQLPSDAILSLLQWALWPEAALREAYPEQEGWRLAITPDQRNLFYRHRPVLSLRQIDVQTIEIDHLSAGYTVRIEPLESSQ